MKNSEEDILKRFLQDTFWDYKPEPNGQTWENIRKEIQPQQPNVGAGLGQWIVPVVALLLSIGGIVWNEKDTENNTELALNSTQENIKNTSQLIDYQSINNTKTLKKGVINTKKESGKLFVNKATSKVESKVLPKVEKSAEVLTFSTIFSTVENVSTEKYPSIKRKQSGLNSDSSDLGILGLNLEEKSKKSVNPVNTNTDKKQSGLNSDSSDLGILGLNSVEKSKKSVNPTDENLINDGVIEEVRYIKPLETLKNKDFVLVKNELRIPQISEININRAVKPIRQPLYVNVSIMPLQTYRILTVNSEDIQNLQTNNLFDSERNGFAFELGITKPIGNKWNFRSSISFLKMRQWAEYQVNTNKISVKNSNNYSNAISVSNNDNEFIGQTRVESKTLQMVGLKADVQRFFKISGRNRYFISAGSQLMIEPNEKQTNVFINTSAGFQHLVNKDCFLTIEPTASYLLNNINDSKSLIQTNAYNLGLKVGVSFKIK